MPLLTAEPFLLESQCSVVALGRHIAIHTPLLTLLKSPVLFLFVKAGAPPAMVWTYTACSPTDGVGPQEHGDKQ